METILILIILVNVCSTESNIEQNELCITKMVLHEAVDNFINFHVRIASQLKFDF